MVAVEIVFEEVNNRMAYWIGGRVGMTVGFKGGVKTREAGV